MDTWSGMAAEDIDLQLLEQEIRKAGRPLHANILARAAVRAHLERAGSERSYAPGAQYAPQEVISFDGQQATVLAVEPASNPKQGAFKILTLMLEDGTERYMAAEVAGAPAEHKRSVTDAEVDQVIAEHGATVRAAVSDALGGDGRFVWFQDPQGDLWCLADMPPVVSEEDLAKVAAALPRDIENGELVSSTTEELVRAVWGSGDDGSAEYALRAFALGRALLECEGVEYMVGRWVWTGAWRAFTQREPLTSPRMPTQVEIPAGIAEASEAEIEEENRRELVAETGDELPTEDASEAEDLESWRSNRLIHATFTLSARHYYEGWLPLTKQAQRLFPPFAAGKQEVIFHHHFADSPESFPAWVDREEGRIWVSKQMYETLRNHRIYPGARLRISARNEREYDIYTRPPTKEGTIRVWRMWLENGTIQYDPPYEEPRQYDIDDDVFVADVRFEDLDALFRQAEKAGNSIFGLMYAKCVEWCEAQGRKDLLVTADDLFEAIHFDEEGRMTSKATIAWELWRRLAFKSVGGGSYLFRPKFGGLMRSAEIQTRPPRRPTPVRPRPTVTRRRRLREIAPEPAIHTTARDLWAELEADEQRMAALRSAVQAYMADPLREKVLFLREKAHQRIRELVSRERLNALTLHDFNRHIWQIGSCQYRGRSYRIDSEEMEALLREMSTGELQAAYDSGELGMEGNQTWGSGSSVIGPRLNIRDTEMEQVVRDTLRSLLYGEGTAEQRMDRVIREPNGFGMNVVTGILHAVYPAEQMLYNSRSVDALKLLGISWPTDWQNNIESYVIYRDLSRLLQEHFAFRSLTDIDWFMYQVATRKLKGEIREPEGIEALWDRYVLCLNPARYIGWTVVHQRKLKGYYDLWANYLKFMDEYPGIGDALAEVMTGIHWRGTMHARYLGLITESRIVTPVGREFYSTPDARDNILHRQFQKWYYCVDLFCDPDPEYRVYPLFALLRILLSLPESHHAVSVDELRYFVLPTRTFDECDDRVVLIRDFRKNSRKRREQLERIFQHTYINRIGQMLELSPYLLLNENTVGVRPSYVRDVKHMLTQYEELEREGRVPHYPDNPQRYLDMLRSTDSIFEFCVKGK